MCFHGGKNPAVPSSCGAVSPCAAGANGPFATPDDAARAALNSANPQSIRDNREYSGLIYRGADGNATTLDRLEAPIKARIP